jgi:hypothetical protein
MNGGWGGEAAQAHVSSRCPVGWNEVTAKYTVATPKPVPAKPASLWTTSAQEVAASAWRGATRRAASCG